MPQTPDKPYTPLTHEQFANLPDDWENWHIYRLLKQVNEGVGLLVEIEHSREEREARPVDLAYPQTPAATLLLAEHTLDLLQAQRLYWRQVFGTAFFVLVQALQDYIMSLHQQIRNDGEASDDPGV